MRQLLIQVPRGQGAQVLSLAQKHQGANLAQLEAKEPDRVIDLVIAYLPNRQVEKLLDDLEALPAVKVTLVPSGMMPLQPPADEAPQQVTNVQARSPIEIFLAGLQSIGSWSSFLAFAAIAGVIVWIGLFTNSSFLLVAAMLIAPFAGPAMNVAIGTARGDRRLLRRSLLRYFCALAVTIATAALLSLVFNQQNATNAMVANSQISVVAVLLPLTAGAAGALQLVQSERSSLVSGAAVGMLVAASLAPPAGLVGMSLALGEWDMAKSGAFLLILQLAGINLAGAAVFRLYGLSPQGARYKRGDRIVFPVVLALTGTILAGLLTWQFSQPPNLQRSSRVQSAVEVIQNTLQQDDTVYLVEANVRFTRASIPGQNTLLGVIYVQPQAQTSLSDQTLSERLSRQIQQDLLAQGFNVTPLINVIVLSPPAASGS
ncbi:DUF389 domain-containing protein [Almyronema epifaneia]|uniref:DUF389 domain-containing protein n=1 Tax=Almyronema epifaneia S1 TaxID=2991925 RepID=A0ABW6IIC4_9CYAN